MSVPSQVQASTTAAIPAPGQRVRIRADLPSAWTAHSIRGQEAIAVHYEAHTNRLWFVTVLVQSSSAFVRPNTSAKWLERCQPFVPAEWLKQHRLMCTPPYGLDILDDDDNMAVGE